MAGNISIRTGIVKTVSDQLDNINRSMDNEFDSVKNAMNKLYSNWNSVASQKASSKFNKINYDYCGSSGRRAVMDSYIKFLKNTVVTGYENTEQKNISLSELFK